MKPFNCKFKIGVKNKRKPYQTFEIQLQSPAAAVTTNPHQQRPQQSSATCFSLQTDCAVHAGVFPHCFLSTWANITYALSLAGLSTAQYANSEETSPQFTSQPFTSSSKASCGSTGNFIDLWEQNNSLSLDDMTAKASMD